MTSRPRIQVRTDYDAAITRKLCEQAEHTTPGIHIEVTFDLHDHKAALQLLEAAIAETKFQIEETT